MHCGDSILSPGVATVFRPQTDPADLGRVRSHDARPDRAAPAKEKEHTVQETRLYHVSSVVTIVTCILGI